MGGKKRSRSKDDEEYDDIMNKLKKLEQKVKKRKKSQRHHRNRISTTESESQEESPYCVSDDNDLEINDENVINDQSQTENIDNAVEECSEINQEILKILGDDSSTENLFGDNLHKDVSTRWQHILLKGLVKDNRAELLRTYLPPENCPNIKAPKLNLEIKAALTEINNKKDAYSQNKQNQLASCLAAVGKALSLLITTNKDDVSQEVIKSLSDAGRLLCDYHYKESQSRRYAIINTLNKQTRDTIKNTKIDEYLFGSDLAEHLKSSKAISKSGMELRPTITENRSKPRIASRGQASAASRGTLNARGAPHVPAAEARANPAPRKNYAAPVPFQTRHRNNYNSKNSQRHRGRRN